MPNQKYLSLDWKKLTPNSAPKEGLYVYAWTLKSCPFYFCAESFQPSLTQSWPQAANNNELTKNLWQRFSKLYPDQSPQSQQIEILYAQVPEGFDQDSLVELLNHLSWGVAEVYAGTPAAPSQHYYSKNYEWEPSVASAPQGWFAENAPLLNQIFKYQTRNPSLGHKKSKAAA